MPARSKLRSRKAFGLTGFAFARSPLGPARKPLQSLQATIPKSLAASASFGDALLCCFYTQMHRLTSRSIVCELATCSCHSCSKQCSKRLLKGNSSCSSGIFGLHNGSSVLVASQARLRVAVQCAVDALTLFPLNMSNWTYPVFGICALSSSLWHSTFGIFSLAFSPLRLSR